MSSNVAASAGAFSKIIHMSDLHVDKNGISEITKFDRLVGTIVEEEDPSTSIVIITGDLCDTGSQNTDTEQVPGIINKLTQKKFKVFVIPGNHDYAWLAAIGLLECDAYIKQFKQIYYGDTSVTYPKKDVIGNLVIVGLDSTAPEIWAVDNAFSSRGKIGDSQSNDLDALLTDLDTEKAGNPGQKTIVYLHHHPFTDDSSLYLEDRVSFQKLLAKHKVDALLFGHIHHEDTQGEDKSEDTTTNIPLIFNAGSSTNTDNLTDWSVFYRVIDLTTGSNEIKQVICPAAVSDGIYLIENLQSGLLLNPGNGANKTSVSMVDKAKAAGSAWKISLLEDNCYHIESVQYANQLLEQSSSDDSKAQMYQNLGESDQYVKKASNQKWQLNLDLLTGSYKIANVSAPDRVIDAKSGGDFKVPQIYEDQGDSSQYCANANNQRWILTQQS